MRALTVPETAAVLLSCLHLLRLSVISSQTVRNRLVRRRKGCRLGACSRSLAKGPAVYIFTEKIREMKVYVNLV